MSVGTTLAWASVYRSWPSCKERIPTSEEMDDFARRLLAEFAERVAAIYKRKIRENTQAIDSGAFSVVEEYAKGRRRAFNDAARIVRESAKGADK